MLPSDCIYFCHKENSNPENSGSNFVDELFIFLQTIAKRQFTKIIEKSLPILYTLSCKFLKTSIEISRPSKI